MGSANAGTYPEVKLRRSLGATAARSRRTSSSLRARHARIVVRRRSSISESIADRGGHCRERQFRGTSSAARAACPGRTGQSPTAIAATRQTCVRNRAQNTKLGDHRSGCPSIRQCQCGCGSRGSRGTAHSDKREYRGGVGALWNRELGARTESVDTRCPGGRRNNTPDPATRAPDARTDGRSAFRTYWCRPSSWCRQSSGACE